MRRVLAVVGAVPIALGAALAAPWPRGARAGEPTGSSAPEVAAAPAVVLVVRVPRERLDEVGAAFPAGEVRLTPVGPPAGRRSRWLRLGAPSDRVYEVGLGALSVGGYDVTALPCGYATYVYVRADSDRVRVTVPRPRAVRVAPRDAASGATVAGATVEIDLASPASATLVAGSSGLWPTLVSERAGFALVALPGQAAGLRVRAPGYAPRHVTVERDGDDLADATADVALFPAAAVRVSARVRGARVGVKRLLWAFDADRGLWTDAVPDADGLYRDLPVGTVVLSAWFSESGLDAAPQRVMLRPRDTLDVTFEATPRR